MRLDTIGFQCQGEQAPLGAYPEAEHAVFDKTGEQPGDKTVGSGGTGGRGAGELMNGTGRKHAARKGVCHLLQAKVRALHFHHAALESFHDHDLLPQTFDNFFFYTLHILKKIYICY
ncbi:hypothetical protein [Sphingobacterium haloxyli]|uniref:hypothetical protein n=1 Tax=Sphingobacterium haloxyli TaxID=2100533 RepID=UPI001056F48A|nr:hypothetical protein [Sphingobacterium haloxyli]